MNAPTFVARSAALDTAGGTPVGTATRCACCGTPMSPMTKGFHLSLPDTFSQFEDLADPASRFTCSACNALIAPANQMTSARSRFFACKEGVFRLSSVEDVAWLLLADVPLPFVAAINTSRAYHVAWLTPLSDHKNTYCIRVGRTVYAVAPRAARRAAACLAELGALYSTRTQTRHNSILDGLSLYDRDAAGPHITPYIRADIDRAGSAEEQGLLREFDQLTQAPGNLWASAALVLYRQLPSPSDAPPMPPRI